MVPTTPGLDKRTLEEALRDALKSVLGSTATGFNARVEFYNKFQREMDKHDQDFEKKYDEDLNTTLIFSGLFSAVTSAFIIDLQSELKPDYEGMNNTLLEMLLNATTGSLPAGSAASVPRWSGPDPVIVRVQCILYATLCATLLAAFLAMLGKQWLNRYRQNETRGSTVDRSRVRERKLTGIETWKFHVVMESLPLILQCALVLLGSALSRYLWEVNRWVSSVVIGFACFGFLFYLFIFAASIFSFDCPFQTPFSLLIRFAIGLALPYWRKRRQNSGPTQQPPTGLMQKPPIKPMQQPSKLKMLGSPYYLPFSVNNVGRGYDLEASITAPARIAPALIQPPGPAIPLFMQETEAEADKLNARCITRMFTMSIDPSVVISVMDFIPEVIWHNRIKNVPLKRIYDILMDCFYFSGSRLVMIPKLRDVAYLSAKAFTHIALQRRCITQYEEDKQDGWKTLCASHPLLSPTDYGLDSDLGTVLFMVDMTLGCKNGFPWGQTQMTLTHHAWMSHVFLYRAWCERQSLSEVVMQFVESSMSLRLLSDTVITDCLFIIGLMVGVPLHISDITVKDKSRERTSVLGKLFGVLSIIFSFTSVPPSAIRALQFVTRLRAWDVSYASYELFKTIMASNILTDQHWEAARLTIHGAFEHGTSDMVSSVGKPTEILKFLNHHLGLQGTGEDHSSSIAFAMDAILVAPTPEGHPVPLVAESIRDFDCTSPSFVKGICSIMHSSGSARIQGLAVRFIALISDQWFNSPIPIMSREEMSKFCKNLAVFMTGVGHPTTVASRHYFPILFGMLRSLEWRNHMVTGFWSLLALWTLVEEEEESFKWCLRNAIELLEFTSWLPDGEGFKWWYGTLWFHFGKLDPTVRIKVESIAREMSSGDGLSDLNLYLDFIGQEVEITRRQLVTFTGEDEDRLGGTGMKLRARFATLERNHRRLAQIIDGQ